MFWAESGFNFAIIHTSNLEVSLHLHDFFGLAYKSKKANMFIERIDSQLNMNVLSSTYIWFFLKAYFVRMAAIFPCQYHYQIYKWMILEKLSAIQ